MMAKSHDLYYAVRPMLAVSGGRLVALSTPFGKRGWFHHEYEEGQGWERIKITAYDCPRISPAFLEEVLIHYYFDYESARIWRSEALEMSRHDR
jgi:hypothetical protein